MISIKLEMSEAGDAIKAILNKSSALRDKVLYKYQGWKTNKGDRFLVKIKKPGTVDLVGLEDVLNKYGKQYKMDFHLEYPHEKDKSIFWIDAKPSMRIKDANGNTIV